MLQNEIAISVKGLKKRTKALLSLKGHPDFQIKTKKTGVLF